VDDTYVSAVGFQRRRFEVELRDPSLPMSSLGFLPGPVRRAFGQAYVQMLASYELGPRDHEVSRLSVTELSRGGEVYGYLFYADTVGSETDVFLHLRVDAEGQRVLLADEASHAGYNFCVENPAECSDP
jgi:hypothetical protein